MKKIGLAVLLSVGLTFVSEAPARALASPCTDPVDAPSWCNKGPSYTDDVICIRLPECGWSLYGYNCRVVVYCHVFGQ